MSCEEHDFEIKESLSSGVSFDYDGCDRTRKCVDCGLKEVFTGCGWKNIDELDN